MRSWPLLRCCALLLALALFTARIGSVCHENFAAPIQQVLSGADYVSDDQERQKVRLFKAKRLTVDLLSLEAQVVFVPSRLSETVHFSPPPPSRVLPGVSRDIFIPPEERC